MIVVVGTGPGNIKNLTLEAREIIEKSRNILAFGRIAESMAKLNQNIEMVKTVAEVKKAAEKIKGTSDELVILASGDPTFFGITEYLIRNEVDVNRVVTGVSSFQYMMSALKRNSNGITAMSFHGREADFSQLEKGKSYFILTDKKNSPDYISKGLEKEGFSGKIILGENLSYDNEVIITKKIGETFGDREISVVVIDIDVD